MIIFFAIFRKPIILENDVACGHRRISAAFGARDPELDSWWHYFLVSNPSSFCEALIKRGGGGGEGKLEMRVPSTAG